MRITRFRIVRSSGLHPIRANYLVNTKVALNADSPEISLTVIKFSYACYRNIYDIYTGEVHWRGRWREEERRGRNGVKTARWVILPTCSYSYQHMALLITSNYNTCKQCILRYANLVSPLLVLMHSAEVGKLEYIVWARIECCVLYRLWPKVLRFACVSQYHKNSEQTTTGVGFGTFRSGTLFLSKFV